MKYNILCFCSFFFVFVNAQVSETYPSIPRDTSFTLFQTYQKIKKKFPEATPALPSLPQGVTAYNNLVYATLAETPFGKRDLHVDLFRPEKGGKYPALIMVHGGGWRSGNKSMEIPMAQQIAAKGFVTIAVEYQLSMEAKWPAAIHNIKAAIRWVRANADKYGIDTSHIAIEGESAGGQLAALVGMSNRVAQFEGNMGNNEYSSSVHAVIDVDGVLSFLTPSSLNPDRKSDSPDAYWLGGTFYEQPKNWKDASAIFWLNSSSPPVLFLNSGFSRYHAGQNEMLGIMKEFNIYSEVHAFDVQLHPFWLFNPWFEPTVNYMVGFMEKVFNMKTSK